MLSGQTYYQATADSSLRFAPLAGQLDCDTVIIGAGFAGLATAMGLLERGQRSVAVLEAQRVGHGASGRNGGFAFGGYSLDCAALVQQLGLAPARQLYGLTLDALHLIRARIDKHQIACDKVEGGALLADWFGDEPALRAQQRFMREQMQADWQWLGRDETRALLHSARYHGALFEPQAFHFHPLKYAQGLARSLAAGGVALFEQSAALNITRRGATFHITTAQGELHCRQVLVACGGYLGGLVPELQRAMLPIATYVMATEPLGARLAEAVNTPAAIYDTRFAFDYYRALPDTRLLWGGRISILQRSPSSVARLLHQDMLRVYPQLRGVKVEHAWSGLMSYARHSMPQLGRTPGGLWFAMGFGGHGVAPTTAAGELLADALSGRAELAAAWAGYGLAPVHGQAGLLAAQARYTWAQLRDAGRGAWRSARRSARRGVNSSVWRDGGPR